MRGGGERRQRGARGGEGLVRGGSDAGAGRGRKVRRGPDLVRHGVDAVLAAPAQVRQDAPHRARLVAAARGEPAAGEGAMRAELLAAGNVGPLRARPAENRVADHPPWLHGRRAVPAGGAGGSGVGLEEVVFDGELDADGAQLPNVPGEREWDALVKVVLEGDPADVLVAAAYDRFLKLVCEEEAAGKLAEEIVTANYRVFFLLAILLTYRAHFFVPNEGAF